MVQISNSPSFTFNKLKDLDLIMIYMCLFGSQSHHTTNFQNMLPSRQNNLPHNQNVYAIHKFNSYHSNYDLTFQNFILFSSIHRNIDSTCYIQIIECFLVFNVQYFTITNQIYTTISSRKY